MVKRVQICMCCCYQYSPVLIYEVLMAKGYAVNGHKPDSVADPSPDFQLTVVSRIEKMKM
jgi:hypothetical protein